MFEYHTQTTYHPTPAEKRKGEIRKRVYEDMLERGVSVTVSHKYIAEIIALMVYVYDTVEALPDPPEEKEGK